MMRGKRLSSIVYIIGGCLISLAILASFNHWECIPTVYQKENILSRTSSCVKDCITGQPIRCPDEDSNLVIFSKMSVTQLENSSYRQVSFERIYHKKDWVLPEDKLDPRFSGVQGSGHCATLEWTQEAMATLHLLITELKRSLKKDKISILDIPCGDMVWMSRFLKTRNDIQYTGMDIVPHLIQSHQKTYARFKDQIFVHQDIVANALSYSYDLIFCRAMLQHLSLEAVGKVLQHFSQSGSKYLLTSNFPATGRNEELPINEKGRQRNLNLELPPYSLQAPICMSRDGPITEEYIWLALWELPLQRQISCEKIKKFIPPETSSAFHFCSSN